MLVVSRGCCRHVPYWSPAPSARPRPKADSPAQQRFDFRPHQSAQVLVRQARLQLAIIAQEAMQGAPYIDGYLLEHNC